MLAYQRDEHQRLQVFETFISKAKANQVCSSGDLILRIIYVAAKDKHVFDANKIWKLSAKTTQMHFNIFNIEQ